METKQRCEEHQTTPLWNMVEKKDREDYTTSVAKCAVRTKMSSWEASITHVLGYNSPFMGRMKLKL